MKSAATVVIVIAVLIASCSSNSPSGVANVPSETKGAPDSRTQRPTVTTPATGTRGPNCDAAYPTVCIPSPPPDLDCKDVKARGFKVLPPDPHRFDSDGNGIGCEGQ